MIIKTMLRSFLSQSERGGTVDEYSIMVGIVGAAVAQKVAARDRCS